MKKTDTHLSPLRTLEKEYAWNLSISFKITNSFPALSSKMNPSSIFSPKCRPKRLPYLSIFLTMEYLHFFTWNSKSTPQIKNKSTTTMPLRENFTVPMYGRKFEIADISGWKKSINQVHNFPRKLCFLILDDFWDLKTYMVLMLSDIFFLIGTVFPIQTPDIYDGYERVTVHEFRNINDARAAIYGNEHMSTRSLSWISILVSWFLSWYKDMPFNIRQAWF